MTLKGVDIAWARPTTAQIKSAGAQFVARYLSPDSSKNITAAEVKDYTANGLAVVVVWESSANRMLGGFASGQADARAAEVQRAAVGLPANMPIYFACDFDAQGSQYHTINQYLRGVASVIGLNRVGVYGSYYVLENVFSAPVTATFGWQTVAWSNGKKSAHANIYQDGSETLSAAADVDYALTADYGQYPRPQAPATFTSADKIATIAAGEVGYHEGFKAGHWDNIQKYSLAVPGLAWSNGQPWCCVFVAWCAMTAGLAALYPRTAACLDAVAWFKAKGRWSDYPAIGGQIFYGANGGSHTGIVHSYDGVYVYCYEGNTNTNGSAEGDGVYDKTRVRRDAYVYGYGLPAFPEGIITADPALKGKAGYHYAATAAAKIGDELPTPKDVWGYQNVAAGDHMDVHQMLTEVHRATVEVPNAEIEAVKADVAELKALLSAIAAKVGA